MRYEDKIILIVDILGFTNRIKNSETDEDISEILDVLNDIRDLFSKHYDDAMEFTQFSDSIVISVPTNVKGCFYYILRDACNLIHYLFSAGFSCKGVISIGKVYHKGDLLFGPEFLNVLKQEAIEDLPRITFKKEYLELAKKQSFNDPEWELNFLSKYYEKSEKDNLMEISWRENYGDLVGGGNDDTQRQYDEIREFIKINLDTNNLRVYKKYKYLQKKYNNSEYRKNDINYKMPMIKKIKNYPLYIYSNFISSLVKLYWKNK